MDVPIPESAQLGKAKRLAEAFQGVFAQPGRRSSDQRLVMEHLREMCGRDRPIFQQDKEGRFDPLRAAHLDGAATQYLIIKRQLAIALKNAEPKKKPEAKK